MPVLNTKEIAGYIINESAIPGFTETNIISQDKKGRLIAEATLQTADALNRNGRIYPSDELFPQLKCQRTMELMEAGYFRGEMGHPLSTELVRQQTIDDTRTCVQFLQLWTEGKDIKARYRATNNAFGKALNEDLADGCKPAFSLRALGSIVKEPRGNVVRNLRIITYDCVIYPSHPNAYTQAVVGGSLNESAIINPNEKDENIIKTHLQLAAEAAHYDYSDILRESTVYSQSPFTHEDAAKAYIADKSNNFKYVKENFNFIYDTMSVNEDGSKVTLKTKDGDTLVVNVETHIQNEIMNYCANMQALNDNTPIF